MRDEIESRLDHWADSSADAARVFVEHARAAGAKRRRNARWTIGSLAALSIAGGVLTLTWDTLSERPAKRTPSSLATGRAEWGIAVSAILTGSVGFTEFACVHYRR